VVKLVACLRRRPGLSPEAFRRHWRETHGPLIRGIPELHALIRRYVQGHPVGDPVPGDVTGQEPFDGVAEMWFDDLSSMARAFSLPEYLARVRPDEESFLDLRRCVAFVVEEHVVI